MAVAAIPVALTRFKPAAKKIGEKMVEWGEKLQREAERANSANSTAPSSKAGMKDPTVEETLKSASPAGKEEVKEQAGAQQAGSPKPPAKKKSQPAKPKPAPSGRVSNPKKPTKGDQKPS